jgi:hypothetical protein
MSGSQWNKYSVTKSGTDSRNSFYFNVNRLYASTLLNAMKESVLREWRKDSRKLFNKTLHKLYFSANVVSLL